MATIDVEEYKSALIKCRKDLREFISEVHCNPILVRLAWHDSGTYDKNVSTFPVCGGANGSIIHEVELNHGANAGLFKAVNYLKRFKVAYPILSFADIIQLASAEAIAVANGPEIDMIYGRIDSIISPKEGNLPEAAAPFKGEKSAKEHLWNVFYRMGFNDREIVALSGAHTLGRAFKERSGTTEYGYTKPTKYTNKSGMGMKGGASWTENWLEFDNSYYVKALEREKSGKKDEELLWLETDKAVQHDVEFSKYFKEFAESKEEFFKAYAAAHKKLSELGSRFIVAGGIKIPPLKKGKL